MRHLYDSLRACAKEEEVKAETRFDGTRVDCAYDGNGNITEYISNDGVIVSHSDYSSFGRARLTTGDNSFSHGFSTKPTCRRSGLVEYQMRKYMPWLGRWGARDPIEEEGGLNIFEHVFNDPINNSEVKGTIPRALAVAIFVIGLEALIVRYCAESSEHKLPSRPTSDAFKHCYVSCENAKCLARFNSMPIGKALTRLGGVAHEIIQLISGEAHTLEGSLADIKSNERGINAAGNGKDCNDACGCENEHNNPL